MRLNGVADAQIDDLEDKQLTIELDREQLQSHNISLSQLGWQLREDNVSMSLGRVVDGRSALWCGLLANLIRPRRLRICPGGG